MLGGGHVRRRSVGSIIEASPCVRVEKRKHSLFQGAQPVKLYDAGYDSPNKARIIEKPSIASTSSYKFGGERMIKAQRGLLERQSLEDSCLIADGEDLTTSCRYFSFPVLEVIFILLFQCILSQSSRALVLLLVLDRALVHQVLAAIHLRCHPRMVPQYPRVRNPV